MNNDTTTRLAAIRERLANATPGPWKHGAHLFQDAEEIGVIDGCFIYHYPAGSNKSDNWDDAALIANAPTDLSWLLEQVEAAQAQVKDAVADVLRQMRQPAVAIPAGCPLMSQLRLEGRNIEVRNNNDAADTLARQYGVELGPWPEASTEF